MMARFGIGWRQVASCFLLLAAVSFIASGYSIVAVPLAQAFKPTRMVLMLAMTVLSGITGLLSPLLGNLMDRISLRAMMITGSLFLAVGYAVLSFTTSFSQVLVIFGVFIAPANVLIGPITATVLLSRWFVKRRGAALGVAIAGIAMGSVVYPPIVQWLLDHNAWREAFRLVALVLLAGTLPAAALVVNRPGDRGLYADGSASAPEVVGSGMAAARVSAGKILADPAFWLAAAIFATVLSGMKGMITNLAPIVLDHGIKASGAALLISLYGGCGFVAKLCFAAAADRFGPRPLLYISLVGFGCGMVCLTQAAAGYWAIAAGVGLIGLLGGIMVPMQSLLVPRIFGDRVVGRAMGLISAVTLCALLATPPLFGRIFDVTGSYTAIFVVFAVLAAAAVIFGVPYLRLHVRAVAQPEPVPQAG
jgi:MFS family permease